MGKGRAAGDNLLPAFARRSRGGFPFKNVDPATRVNNEDRATSKSVPKWSPAEPFPRVTSLCGMSLSTVSYALAVDDDPFILMDVTSILEAVGFRTYEADDGDAAIAMLPEFAHTITLLFSDVDMPGDTNGFALAHHVAENYPWIETAIGSGHLRPKEGDMPEKATFVSKPFNAQMIHGHLRETLPDGKLPEQISNGRTYPSPSFRDF